MTSAFTLQNIGERQHKDTSCLLKLKGSFSSQQETIIKVIPCKPHRENLLTPQQSWCTSSLHIAEGNCIGGKPTGLQCPYIEMNSSTRCLHLEASLIWSFLLRSSSGSSIGDLFMEDGEENLEDTFLPSYKVLSTSPLLVFSLLLPLPPNPSICSSLLFGDASSVR